MPEEIILEKFNTWTKGLDAPQARIAVFVHIRDIALKKAGLPANENWDGESDTLNAVVPFDEIIHVSLAERLKYVKEKKSLLSEIEKATYAQFIEKFNAWRSLIHCIT